MRDKLGDNEDVLKITTEEQREEFLTLLSAAEEWLYEDDPETLAADFRTKLRSLKLVGDKIMLRVSELADRPAAVEKLKESIGFAKLMIENLTATIEPKEGEIEELLESLDTVSSWLETSVSAQDALQPHEELAFTSSDLGSKWKPIETKLKTLIRRPKKKPPKVVVEEANVTEEEPERIKVETEETEPESEVPPPPPSEENIEEEASTKGKDEL